MSLADMLQAFEGAADKLRVMQRYRQSLLEKASGKTRKNLEKELREEDEAFR